MADITDIEQFHERIVADQFREIIAAAVHMAASDARGRSIDRHNGERWCRRQADELVKWLAVAGYQIVQKP